MSTATRYIAVASPSQAIIDEWRERDPTRVFLPVPRDYALMKVLYNLRRSGAEQGIHVNVLQHTKPVSPLDFSGLRDTDVIYIVGHGNSKGLYVMGHEADDGMTRLVDILTADGSLKRRRQGKKVTILLLSCRAGLGFHKALARRLSKKLAIDVTVGGAQGFTFGSIRTTISSYNEVLIRGIPWIMEYPGSLPLREAENETSAREGKTITVAGKSAQIAQFVADKKRLEGQFDAVVKQLRSTEVNSALNEVDTRFRSHWATLLQAQFELYALAKKRSNLEFDMWFDLITDGYLWTDGRRVTDAQADALLEGVLEPVVADGYTSTR